MRLPAVAALVATLAPDAALAQSPSEGARALLVHTNRDGLGAGAMLPLGRVAAVRATVFAARDGRTVYQAIDCIPGVACPQSMYVRDRRLGASAALLVRGDAFRSAHVYVGVDAALRHETQRQTWPRLCTNTDRCADPGTSLSRWTVRPGLVGGAEVALGPRLGAFVEASAAVIPARDGGSEWRETVAPPVRAGAGLRMGW